MSTEPLDPRAQLDGFVARHSDEVAAVAQLALAWMRRRLPGAVELVYDNYNALAISFGPTESVGDAIFSIAVYPRWVSLFFLQDAPRLADPDERLLGSGNKVRHVVLTTVAVLDEPAIQALMAQALARAPQSIDPGGVDRVVIKSVSDKQRLRRVVSRR